jgi:catechol 2,3-dioxygenase-like lactoylglutathione lyase family enzyme
MYRLFTEEQLTLVESDPEKFNAIVRAMNAKDLSFQWLFDNAAWRFGSEDYADLMVGQKKYTLEGVAKHISCPTLVVESVADGMFIGQPQLLYDALQCPKTLVVFTREEAAQAHCQLGASSLSNEKIFNWLDEMLKPEKKDPMFKLHHLGVVVRDMDEAVRIYCDILGLDPSDARIQRFTGKSNKTAMVPIGAESDFNSFELLEPIAENWLEEYALKDRAEGFFHVAVLVDNFDEKVKELQEKGYTLKVDETENPFPGCKLLREAYVLPKDSCRGILFDLIDAEHFPASEGGLAPVTTEAGK